VFEEMLRSARRSSPKSNALQPLLVGFTIGQPRFLAHVGSLC